MRRDEAIAPYRPHISESFLRRAQLSLNGRSPPMASAANPPRICRSPLDRSTLTDSMRPYPTATQPQFKLNHKSGGRGTFAAHGDGETPAQGGKPSAYPPSDSESRSDALAGVQICRQGNLSEKRRARFGQRSCPRLARSVESPANHAKQIGRTRIGNPFARFPTDGLRPRPRASIGRTRPH